jgi:Cu+-exporting ATPase
MTGKERAGCVVTRKVHLEKDVNQMTKDPVCGMMVDEEKAAATSEYKGKTYYFCARGCKAAFDKNPEKYLGDREEHHGAQGMHH